MKKIRFKLAWIFCVGAIVTISSCSKENDTAKNSNPVSSETTQQKNIRKIKELVKKLPIMKVIDREGQGHRLGHRGNSMFDAGFSFSDPNSTGLHFSNSSGVTYSLSGTSSTFVIPTSSFGTNAASGGTVVAGSSSLDIGFTFCFNSNGTAVGLDLFDLGTSFTGVSAVIGVSGDFQAIANGTTDSTTNFADLFHGFAFYIVYDGTASGSYDVVNWLTDDLNDTTATHRKCFSFVIDFVTGHLYMSSSGGIEVTGGTMDFNGEYLDVGGIDLATFDLNASGLTYSTVPGFGAMGCN